MRKILYMILTLCFALYLAGCGAASGNGIKSKHVHCVCAGDSVGVGGHTACAKKDGWQEIATAQELTAAITASSAENPAYVALTADITVNASMQIAETEAVNICLNGKKLNAAADVVGKLNITDCVGTGAVVGSKSFTLRIYSCAVVNMYGGTITTTGSMPDTQIVIMDGSANDPLQLPEYDAAFNFYNGTIQAKGKTNKPGHCVYLGNSGIMKMYGGTICDGYVETTDNGSRYGGNVAVFGLNCEFRMYGGEVKDGTVVAQIAEAEGRGGSGGNIAVFRGSLYVTGGTISGGHSNGYGGNIATNNEPKVMQFSNCVIKDGTADGLYGGNVYINAAGEHLTFENVTITGGRSQSYGANIMLNMLKLATFRDCTISNGTCGSNGGGLTIMGKEFIVELKGNMKFENNDGEDIFFRHYSGNQSWLSVAELTATSPIGIGCAKNIEFTIDTVENHPFVAASGMTVRETNGKLVLKKN